MARTTVETQLQKIRMQVDTLQAKEKTLLAKSNSKIIAQIVVLVKKHNVTIEELTEALGKAKTTRKQRTPRTVKKVVQVGNKVPPKYRNPEDATQTWTGRGRDPIWIHALKAAGRLDSALISAE